MKNNKIIIHTYRCDVLLCKFDIIGNSYTPYTLMKDWNVMTKVIDIIMKLGAYNTFFVLYHNIEFTKNQK